MTEMIVETVAFFIGAGLFVALFVWLSDKDNKPWS